MDKWCCTAVVHIKKLKPVQGKDKQVENGGSGGGVVDGQVELTESQAKFPF